jgi:hypothetical protein
MDYVLAVCRADGGGSQSLLGVCLYLDHVERPWLADAAGTVVRRDLPTRKTKAVSLATTAV